jgi:GT2 family glycosyltransferase
MLTSAANTADCDAVTRELDLWEADGLVARFWWRDDDAKWNNDALRRLVDLAGQRNTPIILAVSPGLIEDTFLSRVEALINLSFAAHGYQHINHSSGRQSAEFGSNRPLDEMRLEIDLLSSKFRREFPSRALAMFVPPWHVLDPRLIPDLHRAGFKVLSMQDRQAARVLYRVAANVPSPRGAIARKPSGEKLEQGITRLDCSTELLKYERGGATANPFFFDELVGLLRLRRWGFLPAFRPVGFLTHHLQHDENAWKQLSVLINTLANHSAVRFIPPEQFIPQLSSNFRKNYKDHLLVVNAGSRGNREAFNEASDGETRLSRIAVLITCHNRRDITVACVSALQKQENSFEFSLAIYVVDDGCTDGTADALSSYQNVRVIKGDGNLFWVRGMHLAFAEAMKGSHDGYLWLNDDIVLDPDALHRLLKSYEQLVQSIGKEVIVVGSTRDPDSSETTYGGARQMSRMRPLTFEQAVPGNVEIEIDTFQGNFVYIPEQTARLVGNIDAGFLHKGGDTDYGLRARAAGVRIWLMPGTIGTCPLNPAKHKWRAPGVGIRERWQYTWSPNGIPWFQWGRFARRHGGPLWLLYALWPYRRLVWPSWRPDIRRATSKKTNTTISKIRSQ